MKEIIIPVLLSAFLIPGAGQLYNKEKAKGVMLMVLFFLVILGFVMTLSVALSAFLPADMVVSPDQVRGFVEQIIEEKSAFVNTFWYLTLAIWGYSILDAYLGARDLLKSRETPPPAE